MHLRSLTRKELVTPERSSLPGEDAYRFRHLLIRDAAYDAIPKSARSGLHRAFELGPLGTDIAHHVDAAPDGGTGRPATWPEG